jgi:microsomal prostaglandin-E synthase 2
MIPASIIYGFSTSIRNKVQMEGSERPSALIVYQYKICPFCNRVKALFDYLKLDYTVVEVNPVTKSQIMFSQKKKVPVVKFNDEVLEDSSVIIKHFTDQTNKNTGVASLPAGFIPDNSDKWMDWSEKKLAVMLYPNITRSYQESWDCFSYVNNVEEWSYPERLVTHVLGAFFMSLANGKIKKKYGIVNERKELNTVLNQWTSALDGKKFLHGDFITLPDLAVFGVLRSIEGLQTFKEIMEFNPVLYQWYQNVANSLT